MSKVAPLKVLTEVFREAIGERPVVAAVFTSFTFDPKFFELQVLPALFDRAWCRDDNVRRAQVEEELQRVEHVAVYYDRNAFAGGQIGLDYARYGVARDNGCFHAKHALVLIGGASPSLLVLTTSANLTQFGWWENVEAAHIHVINAGEPSSMRSALLDDGGSRGLLRRLREHERTGVTQEAIGLIGDFLRTKVPAGDVAGDPILWVGRETFPEFVKAHSEPGWNLEVIAPYVEQTTSPKVLTDLIAAVKPRETRVFVPLDRANGAAASAEYLAAVRALKGVYWADLDPKVTAWSRRDADARRFVHAKAYRLFHNRREVRIVGSVNLTAPGHSDARSGNFETAVLVALAPSQHEDWWMSRRDTLPVPGRLDDAEDGAGRSIAPPLHLRFNWAATTLEYFWESDQPPRSLTLYAGAPLVSLANVVCSAWTPLGPAIAETLRSRLQHSAIVNAAVDGGQAMPVIVREEGMRDKPSYVTTLTTEQILEFWSLLTREQRDEFLIRHGKRMLNVEGEVETRPEAKPDDGEKDSMFDRFAGIFHAFSCLDEHVNRALRNGREKEATYRLLGKKHDSLRALVERVVDDTDGDPVNRYVAVLCARQVLYAAAARYLPWAQAHAAEISEVQEAIKAGAAIRDSLDLGPPEERQKFITWFETSFVAQIPGAA